MRRPGHWTRWPVTMRSPLEFCRRPSVHCDLLGLGELHSFAVECERLSEGEQIVPGLQLSGTAAMFVAIAAANASTATVTIATSGADFRRVGEGAIEPV